MVDFDELTDLIRYVERLMNVYLVVMTCARLVSFNSARGYTLLFDKSLSTFFVEW